MTIEKG